MASIPTIVGVFAGDKLAGINSTVQQKIATVEQDGDATIAQLKQDLDAKESSSPLVQTAVSSVAGTLAALGLQVPSEEQIFTRLTSAANNLVGAFKAS